LPSSQGVKISVSRFEFVADGSGFARVSTLDVWEFAKVFVTFERISFVEESGFVKRALFASKTFRMSSKSSAFFKRAETSSEPDATDTR